MLNFTSALLVRGIVGQLRRDSSDAARDRQVGPAL